MSQTDFEKHIQPFTTRELKYLTKAEATMEVFDETTAKLIKLYDDDLDFLDKYHINQNRFIRIHIHRIIEDLKIKLRGG